MSHKTQNLTMLIKHRRLWRLGSLLIASIALFASTNASEVPSYLLIVGFVVLAATLYQLVYGLVSAARLYGLNFKRKGRLAGLLTGIVCFIIALQSIGQLSPRDVVVLLPLVILAYLYSFYGANGKRSTV